MRNLAFLLLLPFFFTQVLSGPIILSGPVGVVTAIGGESLPPQTYTGLNEDTDVLDKLTEPSWPGAGSEYVDSMNSLDILQVTDNTTGGTSCGDTVDTSYTGAASGEQNRFNLDSTKLVVRQAAGDKAVIFNLVLDTSPMTVTCWGLPGLKPGSVTMSRTDADKMWGIRTGTSHEIEKLLMGSSSPGTWSTVFDLDNCTDIPSLTGLNSSVLDNSFDDDGSGTKERIVVLLGDQDVGDIIAIFSEDKADCRWWDVAADQMGGFGAMDCTNCTAMSGGTGIHNAKISKDGLVVQVTIVGAGEDWHWVIDSTDADECLQASPEFCGGHSSYGYNMWANQSQKAGADNDFTKRSPYDVDNFDSLAEFLQTGNVNYQAWNNVYGRLITTISRTSNVSTATLERAHGFSVNDLLTVRGVSDSTFDGDFTVASVPSSTQITYANTAANAGPFTSGSVGLSTPTFWICWDCNNNSPDEAHEQMVGFVERDGTVTRAFWNWSDPDCCLGDNFFCENQFSLSSDGRFVAFSQATIGLDNSGLPERHTFVAKLF